MGKNEFLVRKIKALLEELEQNIIDDTGNNAGRPPILGWKKSANLWYDAKRESITMKVLGDRYGISESSARRICSGVCPAETEYTRQTGKRVDDDSAAFFKWREEHL